MSRCNFDDGVHFNENGEFICEGSRKKEVPNSSKWLPTKNIDKKLQFVNPGDYVYYLQLTKMDGLHVGGMEGLKAIYNYYGVPSLFYVTSDLERIDYPALYLEYLETIDADEIEECLIPLEAAMLRKTGGKWEMDDFFNMRVIQGEMPVYLEPSFKDFEHPFTGISKDMAALIMLDINGGYSWWIGEEAGCRRGVYKRYYNWVAKRNGLKELH
jgi:hypothetical protein